ncbi:hypothetical protein ARMSODRAFT_1023019 [Armillaria solidipes]|uniref:Ribonuclease H1 N-terminal domain-containing protein n=1 Tax=Armillaria solidipes TaxID=1076256 RepID=A0A2H3BJL7_9AGAR|nr:hypothetical protein ARMSODRAFT_1023019 [Armillaria solidipes]
MPNIISLNAVPTLVAVANHHRPQLSAAPALVNAQVPANAQPSSHTVSQGSAPSVAGPSVQANVGPDGPWYAITKGWSIGVFHNWQNVSPLVTGVGRSCFSRYPTQAAALAAFNEAVSAGAVEVL